MKPNPIKTYRIPNYPTLEKAKDMHILFEQPPFYQSKKTLLLAAMAVVAGAMASCASVDPPKSSLPFEIPVKQTPAPVETVIPKATFRYQRKDPDKEVILGIMPAEYLQKAQEDMVDSFGWGPMDFLLPMESEMLAVILDEAEQMGITFEYNYSTYEDVNYSSGSGAIQYDGNRFSLDLYNADMGIGISFVDLEEMMAFPTPHEFKEEITHCDAVHEYNGEKIEADLVQLPGEAVYCEDEWHYAHFHEENIRALFRDFIEWLQAEGVI